MTKRQAKREACLKAATVLQNALDAGWETDYWYPVKKDEDAFLKAMNELIEELERRGHLLDA
jgi:hypothetical protein